MDFVKRDKPMKVFLAQAVVVTLIMVAVGAYLMDRYTLGFGGQKRACLPWDVYLIDTYNHEVKVGNLVAFVADERMAPKFQTGSTVIKQVAGKGGDSVQVDAAAQYVVAGANYGVIEPEGAQVAHKEVRDLIVNEKIPEGHLSVIGTLPRSFDSRYWGYVGNKQVIGRAYGIY